MPRPEINKSLDQIVSDSARVAEKHGFKKTRNILRRISNNNAGIIEFQKSTKSSNSEILFTINVAIVCGALLDADAILLEKSRSFDAHLRQRIGMLMPARLDKWWKITECMDAVFLSTEITEIIRNTAIPFIDQYININELYELWASGSSPGITDTQRVSYMEKLNLWR